tara:strand:+ start:1138 stop:1539 length:402 start_codon:yes stop_codon:yes gene_type:complete
MISDLLAWLNDGAGSLDTLVEPYLRDDVGLPAIVYEIQSEEIERDLLNIVGDLRLSTVSFRCLSNTYSEAESTASAVMSRIADYTIVPSGESATSIKGLSVQSLERSYSLPVESSNEILYEVDISLVVSWSSS